MSLPASAPCILVVDDDPTIAKTLVDLLALHSYRAAKAESGEKALEALRRERFDLVILDLRLPGISGFETCVRIREEFGPSLPVLMLTAQGDSRSLRQGYESGADDFLQKPVDTAALILKVRAFLRLKALHDSTERHREEAQARVRDLVLLHEIGRDWSLIAEPEEFNRMATQRLAGLIGDPICFLALYDAASRRMSAALPMFGVSDEVARRLRYVVRPEHVGLWNFRSGRPYVSNRAASDSRLIQQMVRLGGIESLVLVPMMTGGAFLGLLGAAANERINTIMNHELVHVATMDQATGSDRFFRGLFAGKAMPVSEQPESILYFYLTTPRVAAPRCFLEGGAVFVDTWMAGGIGRAQGAYDEMVFRAMVRDDACFYSPLGLVSIGVASDFQTMSNAYLYGTRFFSYLAYAYSPQHVVDWLKRDDTTERYYARHFERVFGKPLEAAWSDWIEWERGFQRDNLGSVRRHP